jgi:fibronectin-binding autotransporter adhesin
METSGVRTNDSVISVRGGRACSGRPRWAISVAAACAWLSAGPAVAQTTYTKADNTTALGTGSSWTSGTAPTVNEVAGWSGTYNTAGALSALLPGTAVSWGGISVGNIAGTAAGTLSVGGAGTAVAGSSLTIGQYGIDLSAANQNVVVNSATSSFHVSQNWNIASGRNLRFGTTGSGAGNAVITGTNANAVITVSGSGVVDLNPSTTGLSNYQGKWQIDSGATVRTIRTLSAALGSNTASDAVKLNGGTLASGGIAGTQGNWTFNSPITLASGASSSIDMQTPAGTGRWLKLSGTFTSADGTAALTFKDTAAAMGSDLGFIITADSPSMSGTVNIGQAAAGNYVYVRVGGVGGSDTTSTNGGATGSLGTAVVAINNGQLTLSHTNAWTFANVVTGTGAFRIGSSGIAGTSTQDVTLSGSNSNTGGITLATGTLRVGNTSALGAASNAVSLNAGTLDLRGRSVAVGLLTGSSNATITSSTTGSLVLTASSANSGTFAGVIASGSGTIGVTKQGGGTLTLSGSNTYTGVTTVAGGLLSVASDANLGGVPGSATAGSLVISGGTLAASAGFTLNANRGLAVGPASGFGLGAIDVASGQTLSYAGSITDNPGGTGGLAKSGAGTLVLSGSNSHAGGTTLVAGQLNVNSSTALGTGTFTMTSGTLDNTSGGLVTLATDNPQRWDGDVTFIGTNPLDLGNGAVPLAANRQVTVTSSTLTVGGPVSGAFSLTKAGTGALALSGSNSYSAGTTLNAGQLNINSATALGTGTFTIAGGSIDNGSGGGLTLAGNNVQNWNGDFAFVGSAPLALGTGSVTLSANRQVTVTSSTLTVGGAVSGAFMLTKGGAGTVVLSGNNPFTGGFVLAGGTAIAGSGRAFGSNGSNSGAITIQSGVLDLNGQFNYAHAGGPNEYLISGRNLTFGGVAGGTMTLQDTGGTPTGFGIFGSGTVVYDATNNPGTATVSARWAGVGASGVTSRVVNVGDSAATSIEIDFTGPMSVPSSTDGASTTIQKTGAGTMRITGTNSFPVLQISAGRLLVNNANALGAKRTIENLVTVDGGTLDLNGFSPAIGGLSGGGVVTGTITNSATATSSVLTTGSSNATTSFGGRIVDGAGTVGLVKRGTGVLTLSGSNAYSGGTTLASGTIVLGNESALGTASSPLTLNAGTLDLRGNSVAVGLLTGSSGATITSGTTGSVVLTANSAASSTFSGTIASGLGTIGLAKQGAGTLTLAAVNAYTGATTIAAGTLAVSSDANLGTAPGSATAGQLVIAGGALSATAPFTLASNRGIALGPAGGDGDGTISVSSGTLAYGGIIANNGAGTDGLVKAGVGSLRLTGVSTYSGTTTISAGGLEIAGSGQLGSGNYAGTIVNNAALRFESAANQTLSGGISGIGSLAKSGAGRLTLLGDNSYSGPTAVDSGRLVINGIVTTSTITVGSGGSVGGSGTTSTVTLAGGVISPGNSPGTLTTGDLAWDSTSAYDWEMYDYLGTAGTVTGWDLVNGNALTVTGTGFTFNLLSLSGTSTSGPLPPERWSQTTSGTFRMANFTSISAPSGTWWNINATGFTPYSATLGTFSLDVGSTYIDLVYTHTPPSAYVWLAGSGTWSDGANWNTSPDTPEGTPEIEFSGPGGTSTNDIVSGTLANQITTVTGLTFTGSATGSYTVDGNAFNLGSLGVVNESAYQQTVANGMTLAASTLANAAVGPLTLSGTIDTAGYLLTVTGSSNTTLAGVVTGSGGLTKLDVGTLTLAGANAYTGLTTITGGTVVAGNGSTSGALPGGGVENNATLVFDRSDAVTFGGAIGGTGSLVKLNGNTLTLTGSNGYSGVTTISGGTLGFSSSANQTLSGAITGLGSLAKSGAGTLTLTGSSDYAGGTTVTGGTLQLGSGGTTGSITGGVTNDGAIAFNRSDAVTIGSVIAGTGSVTQAGVGSTTLTGVNTYSGNTTIASGTLALGGSGQLGSGMYAGAVANAGVLSIETSANQTLSGTVSGVGALRKSGTGTLTLTAANTYSGGSTLSAGSLLVGNNAAFGTGTATLQGGTLSSDGGTARTLANAMVIAGDLALGDATRSGLLTFSGNVGLGGAVRLLTLASDVTLSGTVTNGGLSKAGGGTLRLSGSNTYTLGTTLATGTIVAANGGALGSSGTITLNTAATAAADTSLLIDASVANVTIARPISVANQGSGLTTIGSGSLASTNQATFSGPITLAKDVTLVAATSGDRTQFTGGISGTGNVTVTTVGTGRVIFVTASNSFAGNVAISANSRLQIGDGGASTVNLIPDSANVSIGAGGRLQLSKGANSETINALLGSGTVEINNGTAGQNATLIVGSAGGSGTYSGVLANGNGVLLFTKQGAGTQLLTGSGSYTGATTISQGTLRVTGAGVLGGLAGSVTDASNILFTDANSGAALEFESAANLGAADQVRFRNTGGTAGQGAVLRYIGTTSQTVSKTLQCDTSIGIRLESNSVGGAVTFNGAFSQTNRNIYLGGSGTGDNELASAFAGTGGITKRDAGTWVLSGSNTYSGGTELVGGTLRAASLANLGSGYLAVKNGANFVYTGVGSETTTRSLFLDNGAATITMANAAGSLTWNDSASKNQSFTKAGPGRLTIGSVFSSTASITVIGGVLDLTGTSTYTGATTVAGGQLLVNGRLANTSGVTIASGGTLGGSGSVVSMLSGAGLVSPGNSPGIMTTNAVDPSGGLSFAFEFSGTGSPAYGSPTASVNDVLRLTNPSPFTAGLSGANIVDVYLGVATLGIGDTFRGGFYVDAGGDFISTVESATYRYWVLGAGGGTDRTFNGQGYFSLANFDSTVMITMSTVADSANFGGGLVSGSVTQFVVVPEPTTVALAGIGLAAAGLAAARRRRRRAA